jgi:DNA-binding LytR/AlgR family response regulator
VDYLVKPVSFERFFKAITKLNRMMGRETVITDEMDVPKTDSFIYLKVDRDMKKIFLNDIKYIESWKDYVKIFLTGNKHVLVKQSITAMENLLPDKFMRVHRSYIVSFDKISGYNSVAIRLGEHEVPIGRLFKHVVMERLQDRG